MPSPSHAIHRVHLGRGDVSVIESRPYPWPYHGRLLPRQTALMVLRDGPADEEPALSALASLVAVARGAGVRLVYSQPTGDEPLFPAQTGDLVVERPRYGGFSGTDLDLVLRGAGLSDLLIAGAPLELGADCTMREANDLGYECLLIEDCCTALSAETFRGAVSSIQMSGGIFGAVATASDVLAAIAALNGGES